MTSTPPSVPMCPACKAPLDDEHNLRSGAVCPTLEPPPSVTVADQLWAMILAELCNVPEVSAERRRQVARQLADHVAANLDLLEQPSQPAPATWCDDHDCRVSECREHHATSAPKSMCPRCEHPTHSECCHVPYEVGHAYARCACTPHPASQEDS